MIINIYVDDATARRLEQSARELGRTVNDLIESAVSEKALDVFRGRNDDPGDEFGNSKDDPVGFIGLGSSSETKPARTAISEPGESD